MQRVSGSKLTLRVTSGWKVLYKIVPILEYIVFRYVSGIKSEDQSVNPELR